MEIPKKVDLEDIHKIFETPPDNFGDIQRFIALDGVTLTFFPGEIHTILGENGAGKSTLVHILSGLHQPTSGTIRIGGQELSFNSPSDALTAGVAMVHQRPLLSDEITVLENCILGAPGYVLGRNRRRKEIAALAEQWNIKLNPDEPARRLTPENRLYTALLGALYRKPAFLILDEPSGVLAPGERESFFTAMQRARSRGLGIILITHKLDEAVRWSDRISILRRGRLVFTSPVREPEAGIAITEDFLREYLDPDYAAQNAADRKAGTEQYAAAGGISDREMAGGISVTDITSEKADRNPVRSVTFTARPGEITGIIGYPGSGLETLEDILSGMLQADSGTITVGTETIAANDCSPSFFRSRGIAFVPSDRAFRGSNPDITIHDLLTAYRSGLFFRSGAADRSFVRSILSAEGIDAQPNRAVRTLSGGQLQRLILARELSTPLRILILAEPEWGLDIRSTVHLRQKIAAVAASGKTVLVLSDNADAAEKSGLYTRTFTLKEGRLS